MDFRDFAERPVGVDADSVTAETALATLAALPSYYTGGSYYGGRISQQRGPIVL